VDGIILLGSFFIYMFFLYKQEMSEAFGDQEEEEVNLLKDIVISLVCLAAVVFSARFLLEATETIIKSTGLESSLFGVITIGVASAAPELFTALSGFRNEAIGISMGTLIGSNITNPLFAIGGGAIISGYWVPKQLIYWDLPMETVTAAILLVYLLSKKKECELSRWGGVYLIALYGVYLTLRILIFETL
jgi:cation:H+ antiporter